MGHDLALIIHGGNFLLGACFTSGRRTQIGSAVIGEGPGGGAAPQYGNLISFSFIK